MAYRDNTKDIGMVRRTERFNVVWPEEFEAVRVSEERADDIAELFFRTSAPLYNQPAGGDYEQCRYDVWRYFSHHRRNPWWPTFLEAGTMVYERAGGKLVGVCLCAGSQTEGHIFNIFVAPEFRRHGLATRMLQHALTVFDDDCRSHANQRLLSAAAKGKIYEVKDLLTGPEVDARTADGKTALTLAKDNGHEEVAELLIAHGGTE